MKEKNKGFSLVELIIVIAIMAILIGVLAPQYMKYVEKSRISKDEQLADSVYKIANAIAADPDFYDKVSPNDYIEVSNSGIVTNNTMIQNDALPEFISGWPNVKLVSNEYKDKTYKVVFIPTGYGVDEIFIAGWADNT